MPLAVGETFNRYRIEGVLGEGGMGLVYRAHDPRLHRYVALKVLQGGVSEPEVADSASRSKRVLREARAAASLDHPNAVSIFDVGEEGGQPFIAMELIVGRPLRAFVGNESVPLQRRLRWLLDIARVLAAAHKRGLVHRDVKPENVMVRDDDVIKVLDFGIARRSVVAASNAPATGPWLPIGSPIRPGTGSLAASRRSTSSTATFTQRGGLEGTPVYMAPEQMRGEPPDGRADQFAWGIVAFELMTGTMPWRWTGSLMDLLTDILEDAPLLSNAAPDLEPEVCDVVQRTLAAQKKDRFESMDPIVEALEPFATQRNAKHASGTMVFAPTVRDRRLEDARLSAPRGERSTWRRLGTVAAFGALAAGAIGGIAWRFGTLRAPQAAPSVSTSATVSSSPPISPNAEAAVAFDEGMRAYRDSAAEKATAAFERAVKLDPNLGAAYLRLGIFYAWAFGRNVDAREAFARAHAARDTLGERDRMMLRAISLYLEGVPPDFDEMHRRFAAALERFPNDPELLLLETQLYVEAGDSEQLLRSADQFVAATPPFAQARNAQGLGLMATERYEEALASLEACMNTAAATTCLANILRIHTRFGECEKVERDARRQIALAPGSQFGYAWLAQALSGREASSEAVREALQQEWSRVPAGARERQQASDEARVALWRGDFATAISKADRLEQLVAADAEQKDHAEAVQFLVDALVEAGRDADASKAAQRFLARKDGWMAQPWHTQRMHEDPTPQLLEVELRAGTLRSDDFNAARAGWANRWLEHAPPRLRNYVWYYAHGALVRTKVEASSALTAEQVYNPLPRFRDLVENEALGRTYFFAGRNDEALEPLRSATRWCDALEQPIVQTRAFALLGRALEATGDARGACEAYGRVLARWGAARPRSVTAEDVRKRVRALDCR